MFLFIYTHQIFKYFICKYIHICINIFCFCSNLCKRLNIQNSTRAVRYICLLTSDCVVNLFPLPILIPPFIFNILHIPPLFLFTSQLPSWPFSPFPCNPPDILNIPIPLFPVLPCFHLSVCMYIHDTSNNNKVKSNF